MGEDQSAMKIEVKSRQKAIDLSRKRNNGTIAVISISDTNKQVPVFKICVENGIQDILYLQFDDIDKSPDDPLCKLRCMSIDDAAAIVDFLYKIRGKADTLIVHCEFGMSRSAGVAAAIIKILTGNNISIMRNKRYFPNPLCYALVLKAYRKYSKIKKIKWWMIKSLGNFKMFLNNVFSGRRYHK